MAKTITPVRVGCCGFALAQEKYFRAFRAVEIGSSFYNLPKPETAARWRAAADEQAGEDFIFTLKAWQVITHPPGSPTYKRTRIDPHDAERAGHFGYHATIRWAWERTFAIARELRAATVVFQCPQSFRPTKDNIAGLKTFFERAKRGKFHMGWEPRGEWPPDLIASLCGELDLVHIVDPFRHDPTHAGKVRYYRLHGRSGTRYRYSDDELHRLRECCRGKTPTFCFFNNAPMAPDAARFQTLLGCPNTKASNT